MHHYVTSGNSYEPLENWQRRDALKKVLAEKHGITLVEIPCWWDGREERYVPSETRKRNGAEKEKRAEKKKGRREEKVERKRREISEEQEGRGENQVESQDHNTGEVVYAVTKLKPLLCFFSLFSHLLSSLCLLSFRFSVRLYKHRIY